MNWEKIVNSVIAFFKSGAGSVLNSTMSAARSIVSSVTTFFISFVFACYILSSKRETAWSGEKDRLCLSSEKKRGEYPSDLFADLPDIFQFPDRAVCGGVDSWNDVLCGDGDHPSAVCASGRRVDRVYRADSDLRCVYRMCGGNVSDPDGQPGESSDLPCTLFRIAADRGKSESIRKLSVIPWDFRLSGYLRRSASAEA